MDVFGVHQRLVSDYDAFTSSLVGVRDREIQRHLDEERERKARWPDPRISLNPNFRSGGTVAELVSEGILHPDCRNYFRSKEHENDPGSRTLTLHRHQREAIEAAASGDSYVLTTGTGSGKSLAYIVPVVNEVLRRPNPDGISAIVVYPMNALANSQQHELARYLQWGIPEADRKVTFDRYTGQESLEKKTAVLQNKPDILLTNYVMLEYLLTRPREREELIGAAQGLRFLALDELHTYRGRQGADVALLVRRLRDACAAPQLQCIGTSATMASAATLAEARSKVADVATSLFGTTVRPDRVIGETLERATDPGPAQRSPAGVRRTALGAAVRRAADEPDALSRDYMVLRTNPLAVWVENAFGLQEDELAGGRLVRRKPVTVPAAGIDLAEVSGEPEQVCRDAIEAVLRAGAEARHPRHRRPLFAFRLHQFLSKGDTVYTSFEPSGQRHLTSQYQVSVPEHRDKPLIPLAFCRDCGHEYLVVTREETAGGPRLTARRDPEAPAEDGDGYLYVSQDQPWPDDAAQRLSRLPDSWVETSDDGSRTVVQARSGDTPREVRVAPDGTLDPAGEAGMRAWWIGAPFRFCLRCRVSHEQLRARDFVKLATFAAEGRSSAVSLISASVVRSLRGQQDIDERARKLLTFVDNRQDASLQAGHFNDFAQVTQIRGALYRALAAAGPEGLRHDVLPKAIEEALALPMDAFARHPGAKYSQREYARSALRTVLAYRANADLERGWRITMPNLTQTGLLRFDYTDLTEIAADEECWQGAHSALAADSPEHRDHLARVLLDELRRSLAVDDPLLTQEGFDQLLRQSEGHLLGVWALPPKEPRVPSRVAFPGSGPKGAPSGEAIYLSGLGAYGRFLRRPGQFAGIKGLTGARMSVADAGAVIRSLLEVLETHGLVAAVREERDGSRGYQVRSAALRWLPGDGITPEPDPLRKVSDSGAEPRVNTYFRDLYRDTAAELVGLEAREHTAQVPSDLREKREEAFRDGELSLLYCSPTMELGVDIATLNAVAMRNAPPTPANYAQRSGRAGRSGQPALVTTYCSTGSAHDQYYFRRPELMVAGSVTPPRLDLANEELLRSHVHAIWLAETGASLASRMTDVVDAEASDPAGGPAPLRLTDAMRTQLDSETARRRAVTRAAEVLRPLMADLEERAGWWYDGWIEDVVRSALRRFDDDCERWRRLYRSALAEREEQHRIAGDLSVDPKSRRRAQARRAEAESRLKLLRNEDSEESFSDFYTYRYFASEGFLPGYSFPRLPLAAYIPGQRGESRYGQKNGAYIQRPRFIAISEFGPGALIYHEGQRYAVDRVQVPTGAVPGQVATSDVRICGSCGTWYDRSEGADRCDDCHVPLTLTLSRTMALSTVQASPVRRISSDEEERLKSGFELLTGYQFSQVAGRLDAVAADRHGPVLGVRYGDTARVRVFNIGRRKRKHPGDRGFWLDPAQGRWLSAKKAEASQEASAEDEALGAFASADRAVQVIPYVEDRKNIAVLRLAEPVADETVAVTLRYAIERGIEARYQLEDSELDSQDLPDEEGRGRMLFVEGAEGGAGVLRLLHDDPDALAEVARAALKIIHADPDTGRDLDRAEGAPERCELGCYDCLLSYSNQRFHTRIDRHTAVPLLLRLAAATTSRERQTTPSAQRAQVLATAAHTAAGPVAEFVKWLGEQGHRLPDETNPEQTGTAVHPDVVYRLPGADVAVYLGAAAGRHLDKPAEYRLIDDGWLVIRAGADLKEWEDTVHAHPDVFGPGRSIR